MLKVGLIGKDGRTSAIERSLKSSPRVGEAGVVNLSKWKDKTPQEAEAEVFRNIEKLGKNKLDFVIVGPEEPLDEGIVDALWNKYGIKCVGPTKQLARLESSKSFTRELLTEFGIPGNPQYRIFQNIDGIEAYLHTLDGYVIKPDGLTGGKGVKISDCQLFSVEQALHYCQELFNAQGDRPVIIEEKLDGEEFSLMSFCDGTHVKDMVVVQDHKRVYDCDRGPNTGGMGSYSCADHSLPFLQPSEILEASEINKAVASALRSKTGEDYKGILYGGFMVTRNGLRLLEYNARFGDPETLNVLPLLKTDFADICEAIVNGTLDKLKIEFEQLATVCKYIVPDGYPDNACKDKPIYNIPNESAGLKVYEAAVSLQDGVFYLTGSRAIAVVGIGKNLEEAEAIAEKAACSIGGPVFHRRDIGTHDLVQTRVAHMDALRSKHSNSEHDYSSYPEQR